MARSEEPAKFSVTLVPGFLLSKSAAISVKVALREAAANTVTAPESLAVSLVRALAVPPLPGEPDPQPARPALKDAVTSSAARSLRAVLTGCSFLAVFR